MATTSKELLELDQPPRPSLIESILFTKNDPWTQNQQNKHQTTGNASGKPATTAVPTSQVLGKVKDFLGVMAKANEKLELDSQDNSRSNYDIEVLSGNEREVIEMDLLLGVADLHNADAVAAAEAAMGSSQPCLSSSGSSSCSDTEDSSDEDDDDCNGGITTCPPDKFQKSNLDKDESLSNNRSNKRPKIVMLD